MQVRCPPDLRVLVHHGAHLGVGVHHGLQHLGLGHQTLHSLLHTGLLQHLQHGPHVWGPTLTAPQTPQACTNPCMAQLNIISFDKLVIDQPFIFYTNSSYDNVLPFLNAFESRYLAGLLNMGVQNTLFAESHLLKLHRHQSSTGACWATSIATAEPTHRQDVCLAWYVTCDEASLPARPGMPPRAPPRPARPPRPAGAAPGAFPPPPEAQGLGKGAVLGALEAAGAPSALPADDAPPPAPHRQQCIDSIHNCDQ